MYGTALKASNLLDKLDDICSKAFDELYRAYCQDKEHYDSLIQPHTEICDCLSALVCLQQCISRRRKLIEDQDFMELNQHILVMRKKFQRVEDEYQFDEEELDDDTPF